MSQDTITLARPAAVQAILDHAHVTQQAKRFESKTPRRGPCHARLKWGPWGFDIFFSAFRSEPENGLPRVVEDQTIWWENEQVDPDIMSAGFLDAVNAAVDQRMDQMEVF